jgi:hypothetical protein
MASQVLPQIKRLSIGESVSVAGLRITRVRRAAFFIPNPRDGSHARWGTAVEISQDILQYTLNGFLPKGVRNW